MSKASYTRVVVEGRTAGYVNVSTKKVTVDVPNGGSSYARVVVASKGDVSKAVTAAQEGGGPVTKQLRGITTYTDASGQPRWRVRVRRGRTVDGQWTEQEFTARFDNLPDAVAYRDQALEVRFAVTRRHRPSLPHQLHPFRWGGQSRSRTRHGGCASA